MRRPTVTRATLLAHAEKLDALCVVAECTALRAAATQLGIAPSSLSERIQSLESLFQAPLVERGQGRSVQLTPFGRELVSHVRPLLDALVDITAVTKAPLLPKRLRIGAYESLSLDALPRVLAGLRKSGKFSFRSIDVRGGRAPQLLLALANGELDLVVVAGIADDERFQSEAVGVEELGVFYPATMSTAACEQHLADGDWIGLSASVQGHPRFYRQFCASVTRTSPALACDSFEVARKFAAVTRRPAILPTRVGLRGPGALHPLDVSAAAKAKSQHAITLLCKRGLAGDLFDETAVLLRATLAARES